jgi:hypothetical protein
MAQRRMFSQKIVGSDAFIEMPVSARELYFQLGMYADDDGFINPKKIIRMIGASDDDLKIIAAKRFVLPFENGVVVIKHWKINNMIRKDFYEPTIYSEELKSLELKENKAYTDGCQQNVNNLSPQYSIDKVSKGKDRKVKNITTTAIAVDGSSKEVNKIFDVFIKINPTINYGNKNQRSSVEYLIGKLGLEKTINSAIAATAVYGKKFAPVITTPTQLKEKLSQLVAFYQKENTSPKNINLDNL